MRMALVAMAAAALAAPAFAGQNPHIRIYLDADPPYFVHEICPEPMTTFDVNVCVDCFGEGGGIRAFNLVLVRAFGGTKLAQTNLLGGLDFGDPELDAWTIAAGAECAYPDENGIVVAARITYLYSGDPGTLDLAPHPDPLAGRHMVDCNFIEDDLYCISANLGVCVPPNPGEPECYCPTTPAECARWGKIKSLYR
jgi:hypothetical protein